MSYTADLKKISNSYTKIFPLILSKNNKCEIKQFTIFYIFTADENNQWT